MATVLDVVKEALVIIGHLEAGEAPSAEDAQTGTTKLNDMLHAWRIEGVDLGHITAAQSDTLRVDDAFIMGIKYNLAALLAPEYGLPVPQTVQSVAMTSKAFFRANTFEYEDDMKVDRALSVKHTNHRLGSYNIDEG